MNGFYGDYDMTREGSGTSWQPQSTPMSGLMGTRGDWVGMADGVRRTSSTTTRAARAARTETFSTSMLMLMARRELSDGAFGLRLMLSADPLMGRSGYPLLFQTGETADGVTPLIDRQHPHDLIMEAALTYSHYFAPDSSAFVYAGLPGEPALGPEAFMHRLSAHATTPRRRCHTTGWTRRTSPGAWSPPGTTWRCLQARGLRVQRPRARPEPLQHRDAPARFVFAAR